MRNITMMGAVREYASNPKLWADFQRYTDEHALPANSLEQTHQSALPPLVAPEIRQCASCVRLPVFPHLLTCSLILRVLLRKVRKAPLSLLSALRTSACRRRPFHSAPVDSTGSVTGTVSKGES